MAENIGSDKQVQVVVFKLGQEEYGINILQVQEIKRMSEITRIPHVPDYITGVINLRGSVLPVMDLKKTPWPCAPADYRRYADYYC